MNIQPNLFDKVVGMFSPKAFAERMRYRYANKVMQDNVRKYEGAAHSRRTKNWQAPSTSANAEIHQALTFLRNRSRDLSRNNPYAENAIREITNNVVGTGIMPKPNGLTKGVDKKLKAAFKDWAENTDCDYDGHLNFYGLQSLAMRTVAESGEVLIRKHIKKGMAFPLQLQVLEPDFIDTTKLEIKKDDGGYILYGVEFNKDNKIVAYWLWDSHPGDAMQYATKSSRIPAEDIIHTFEKLRPGQFRGVPMAHAAMIRMKDLDEYEDAQLIRQKIAACFTAFVTNGDTSQIDGSTTQPLEKVEPGIIEYLTAGQTVTFGSPPDAGASYDPYVKSNLRAIAAAYGMDYVTLTGDLTAVNFSSGRMGWLKFHRRVSALQWLMLVPQMLNKAWDWYIQMANIMGIVNASKVKVTWTPPRREMIDPAKEVEGIEMSIRAGLTTLPAAIRENGDDPEEIFDEWVEWAKKIDENKMVFTSDPRQDVKPKAATKEAPPPAE